MPNELKSCRDRLIELMQKQFAELYKNGDWNFNEMIVGVADYLLANGVIVPPCKVGDTVYRFETALYTKRISIKETEVERIAICSDKVQIFCKGYAHSPAIFGKTVFLTKEEAEAKLKEVRSDVAKG